MTACLALSACAASEEYLGVPNPLGPPAPFEGMDRNEKVLQRVLLVPSLRIQPAAGMPSAHAAMLQDAVTEAAQAKDLPAAATAPTGVAFTLEGLAETRATSIGTAVTVRWVLRDPEGVEVGRFTSEDVAFALTAPSISVPPREAQTGPWPDIGEAALTRLAEQAAGQLRREVDRLQGRSAETVDERLRVIVSPIANAPGDGRIALTRALASLLEEADLAVEVDWETDWDANPGALPEGAVRVGGAVSLKSDKPETQIVTLAWTVYDDRGREVGTITQSNAVPAGSLDGAWGETAYFAALGAREGVVALVEEMAARRAPPPNR